MTGDTKNICGYITVYRYGHRGVVKHYDKYVNHMRKSLFDSTSNGL